MQLRCMPSLACGSTMLMRLRRMASEGFTLTIAMQLRCMRSLAYGSTMLMRLRCVERSAFGSAIEPPFPSLRSYDLLAHRSQIALRLGGRSKRKK